MEKEWVGLSDYLKLHGSPELAEEIFRFAFQNANENFFLIRICLFNGLIETLLSSPMMLGY